MLLSVWLRTETVMGSQLAHVLLVSLRLNTLVLRRAVLTTFLPSFVPASLLPSFLLSSFLVSLLSSFLPAFRSLQEKEGNKGFLRET